MKKKIAMMVAFGCLGASAMSDNYDLLGRKGSKMNSPMVYKNVDYSKTQKQEQEKIGSSLENRGLAKMASGINSNAKAIVGKFGPKGYSFKACSNNANGCGESFSLGGSGTSWSQYLTNVNNNFINIVSQQVDRNSPIFNYVTAYPYVTRSSYTLEETTYNFTGGVMKAKSPLNSTKKIKFAPGYQVQNSLNRSYLFNSNVGVYLSGAAAPVRLNEQSDTYAPFIVADNGSINSFAKTPNDEMIASRMFRIVHWFSDRSSVFATRSRPSNPAGENPQVYVGLHGDNAAGSSTVYPAKAKDLDNYIYNKRTVEVVAAGNDTSGYFSHKAQAVNAITVGALDPINDKITYYSAHKPLKYCTNCDTSHHKPEVYNYSNFYLDDKKREYKSGNVVKYRFEPFYEGTEFAAAVTAGEISNMLSYNEFYKWHPEVVKAVVLNSNKMPVKYDDLVFDQKDKKNLHHSYYFIGNVNTLMKQYNDYPQGSEIYSSTKKEIRLHFSKTDLRGSVNSCNVDGFEASIAWLNSGNDIANLGGLPQKFEIEGYWRHGNPNLSNDLHNNAGVDDSSVRYEDDESAAYKHIIVDGRANDHHPLGFTVRIVLTEEDSRSENYGQMVLGLDIKTLCK